MRTSALLALFVLLQAPVHAQTASQAAARFTVPALQMDAEASAAPRWHHRVLTALGSAALGAGVGYFASQLARGDWEDGPGQPKLNRPIWAAVGGSVGLAVGFSFPLHRPARPPRFVQPTGRSIITAQEIVDVVAVDAYEAVRVLRPEWLIPRNADIIGDFPQQSLPVYLDDFRLGGIDNLRGLAAHRIESIRFITAGTATARWGIGNNYGAIQVVTRG